MFKDGIRPESLPERIYALCKVVSEKKMTKKELANLFEPLSLNNNNQSYFNYVFNSAMELKLIDVENDIVVYLLDEKNIMDINKFRMYCNSILWDDSESLFYKMLCAFLNSNDKFFQYSTITSPNVISYIEKYCNHKNADSTHILGIRFWISFLGFGYIHEFGTKIQYIPNLYIALKDFIRLSNIEIGKEYSIEEFFNTINKITNIPFVDADKKFALNFATSTALRILHDKNEIEIVRRLDSKLVWNLFKSNVHQKGNEITHIIYKGVK